ncbi:MAG: CotH kinase family protein [Lentisphaerae bacterium]|nr:CotH kinase family protein [Lentisphaerota bacterium]
MRRLLLILCGIALILCLGVWMEKSSAWEPMRRASRVRSVPSALLRYGALGELLRRHGLVTVEPNDGEVFPLADASGEADLVNPFQKKRRAGDSLFRANPGGAAAMPGSRLLTPGELKPGCDTLVIAAGDAALTDPETGIMSHWEERGREWERVVHVSYYRGDELVFASGCGLRMHGGKYRKLRKNYRLYLRASYGSDSLPYGILWHEGSGPARTLVLKRDRHYGMLFSNSIGFDIVRRLGALTPAYHPVSLYLNRRFRGVYCLTEHLSRRQWREHVGHDDFFFVRSKGKSDHDSKLAYQELLHWALNSPAPMTLESASRRVDLDNLSRHLLSVMFLANADWLQGAAVLDEREETPRWQWISWDMDQCFVDVGSETKDNTKWKQEAFSLMLDRKETKERGTLYPRSREDVRPILFLRLWDECLEFRELFLKLTTDELNHRLDEEFLLARWAWYMQLGDRVGADDAAMKRVGQIGKFVRFRPAFLREELCRYSGSEDPVTCEVTGPGGIEYEIDGHREGPGYRGVYFAGQKISVTAVASSGPRPNRWKVNGELVDGDALSLELTADTVIEPDWSVAQ